VDHQLDEICEKDLNLLLDTSLIMRNNNQYKSTEYGIAMAAYYIKFGSMKIIMLIKQKARVSGIVWRSFHPYSATTRVTNIP